MEKLLEERTLFFAIFGDAVNESFLSPIIQRDVTGHRPAAENPDFAHSFRTDPADGEISNAAVGKAQAGVGDVIRFSTRTCLPACKNLRADSKCACVGVTMLTAALAASASAAD